MLSQPIPVSNERKMAVLENELLLIFPTTYKKAGLYLILTERLPIFHAEVEFSLDLSTTQIHGVKG